MDGVEDVIELGQSGHLAIREDRHGEEVASDSRAQLNLRLLKLLDELYGLSTCRRCLDARKLALKVRSLFLVLFPLQKRLKLLHINDLTVARISTLAAELPLATTIITIAALLRFATVSHVHLNGGTNPFALSDLDWRKPFAIERGG